MSFKVNGAIGPYQILKQIGQGGMGTVYKAYHQELDRFVALKVLHPAHQEDQTFIGRFQREARLVAKLEHPNIVPIYDFSRAENQPYLVMKYIEGTTLKQRLANGPLGFNEVTQVVNSVGSALAYAHQQGVLHRDIKPSNILIGTDGIMYLADFGLARITNAEASTLSVESIVGTPHYLAPEQATGKDAPSERTDVYSFGVMLYEIIVGQIPFDSNSALSIIHDHVYTPLPMPRLLNPNVSEQVEVVLLKALAKDSRDRYEDITQMVSEFNNAWLSTNYAAQSNWPAAPVSGHSAQIKPAQKFSVDPAIKEDIAESKHTTNLDKRKNKWLYVGLGIALLVSLMFNFIPDLRKGWISNLTPTYTATSTTAIGSTSTDQGLIVNMTPGLQVTSTTVAQSAVTSVSQATNTAVPRTTNTSAPQATSTPVPQSTNTSAPNPTTQPTLPPQNILTPPPLIETVINVIPTSILPPLLP